MKFLNTCGALVVSVAIGACGGGGGIASTPTPPPVEVPTPIGATLIQAGSVLPAAQPSSTRMRLIQSKADLDAVILRLPPGSILLQDSAPDFSSMNLVYLEGAGDNDPSSAVSLSSARKNSDGSSSFNVEYCGNLSSPATHRPFSLYTVPALTGAATFAEVASQLPNCGGRTRVPATLVASGDLSGGKYLPLPPERFMIATNQGQWNTALQRIPGAVPQQYVNPDFTQVNMVYLEGYGDNDQASYVRLLDLLRASPSDYFLYAEYCGSSIVFIATHTGFAVYAVPLLPVGVRVEWSSKQPPNCLVPR